jgi:DMSO/TMAO reductase YedYZ molybdopterin-dependent catalytic subunit
VLLTTVTDVAGFWETHGYHNDADPWAEERFSD